MRILQYFESQGLLSKSGIGHAQKLQQKALASTDVIVTTDALTNDYDILHINTYGPWSIFQIRRARFLNKKIIYHAHSTFEDFQNSFTFSNQIAPFYKRYLVSLYARADAIITPTPYSKKLLEGYGITLPIYDVSNGVDVPKYEKDQRKIDKFKAFIHADENKKIIISVGLFFERKGILDFVELAKRHPEYQFVWFGHTNKWIIPAAIRKVLEDHPDNLSFPGYITGDMIQGAYAGADLFLYPSYEETEGIVVLEALASAQNVLLRDIPVYKDWLEDAKNVYKAKDIDEFDKKMVSLLEKKLKSIAKQGKKVAQQRDLPKIGRQLELVYEEVLTNAD